MCLQVSVYDNMFSLILGFNFTELRCRGLMCEATLILQRLEKLRRYLVLPIAMYF